MIDDGEKQAVKTTPYGDAVIALGFQYVNCRDFGNLHDIRVVDKQNGEKQDECVVVRKKCCLCGYWNGDMLICEKTNECKNAYRNACGEFRLANAFLVG